MLITREIEYAIRMIRALTDNEIKSVGKICDDEGIPTKWAYKILKKMERANLVKAFYGTKGGYQLNKKISQITMLDIVTINKNALRFGNEQSNKCVINKEFERLKDVIKSDLRERTMDKVI